MARLPQRQSLPRQAADIISQMIAEGELTDYLPGERDLSNRLQIGRDTLRVALEILETEQAITPSQHGKRREIIYKNTPKSTVPGAKKVKRIAFLSPKSLIELPPWMLVEVDSLRSLLNQRGYEFEIINPGIFHLKKPDARLSKLIDNSSFDTWILYQCPAPVQQWFQQQQIPTLIRGFAHENIDLPCVDVDWKAAAFHAGGELIRHNHKSIGFIIPNTELAGHLAIETGLREAVETQQQGIVHKIVDKADTNSVHNALERAFKLSEPPTAIITARSRQVLTVITWLAQHQIRIPQDLTIISLSYESWFEHISPEISHYHTDPNALAKIVLRKIVNLSTTSSPSSSKIIIPEYVKGKSVRTITSNK